MNLKITVDGSCKSGRSRAGIVIRDSDTNELVKEISKDLTAKTNNMAEYQALLLACDWVLEASGLKVGTVTIFTDSQLLVRQLNGAYRVCKKVMQKLHSTVCQRLIQLQAKVIWQSREEGDGPRADELSKEELCKSKFSGPERISKGSSLRNWQQAVFALSKNLTKKETQGPSLSGPSDQV